MTHTLDSSPVDEDPRRREILLRTRMGLTEDLDDLRGELVEDLEDFEARLNLLSQELPTWLNLPNASLRSPFKLPEPDRLDGILIGPRAIAVIAADVEDFVREWFGDDDTIPAWDRRDDDDAIARLQREYQLLEELLGATIDACDDLATDGPLQLEQILESIVFELEARRETDVEALESLIQDGDIKQGRSARAEIAALWEDQRRRVDELQRVWDDILNLHHEGISQTLEGLEELQQLSRRAQQGIHGAGVKPAGPALSENKTTDTGDVDSQSEESESPSSDAPPSSEDATPTIPDGSGESLGAESSSETLTNPFLRSPSEVEEVELEEEQDEDNAESNADEESPENVEDEVSPEDVEDEVSPEETPEDVEDEVSAEHTETDDPQIDDAQDEKSDPEETETTLGSEDDRDHPTQPDSPGPTQPMLNLIEADDEKTTSKDEARESEHSTALESSEPGDTLDLNSTSDPSSASPAEASQRDTEEPELAQSDAAPESLSQAPDPATPTTSDPPDDSDSPVTEEDQIRVRTFRLREGWQTVGLDEVAVTLAPAGLFIATLFVLSLLSLVDITSNPMTQWEPALPATFAAMILLLCLPIVFRWRPMWRGTRFRIIRRGGVEEEVDLHITADNRLILDRTSWSLDDLRDAALQRWQLSDDGTDTQGWLLTISPPYHSPFQLATFATSLTDWQQSSAPLHPAPEDAWQLPPEEFDALRTIIGIER